MILLFLSFNLPTSFISGYSTTLLYVCFYQWDFSFCNFHISSCGPFFLFPLRDVPLGFLVKLLQCSFHMSVNSLSFSQIWVIAFRGRLFMVVGFSPSPLWSSRHSLLVCKVSAEMSALWKFPYTWQIAFPLLLCGFPLYFFLLKFLLLEYILYL